MAPFDTLPLSTPPPSLFEGRNAKQVCGGKGLLCSTKFDSPGRNELFLLHFLFLPSLPFPIVGHNTIVGSLGSVRPFVRRYSVFPPLPLSYSLFTDPFSTAGHRAHTGTVVCICPHRSNTASVLFLSSRTRLLLSGERALDSALDLTHLLFGRTARREGGTEVRRWVGEKESRNSLTPSLTRGRRRVGLSVSVLHPQSSIPNLQVQE